MADIHTGSGGLAEPLTKREQEILACLAEASSNQEIANQLHLAEKTVRWYNSQIYSKLGVNNRQDAIKQAGVLGLLTAPANTPAANSKHNLPAQATPFIGRRHELGEIAALLTDPNSRLITILAPGGMGKTRLAIEAARTRIGHYADGVFFVLLAPLRAASDIVTAIAETIGFSFYGEQSPEQQLVDFLRDRTMMLVLDNFEHLLDGAPLVADLVQAAPDVRVLATSRERLNLHGETVYTLSGLDFPTWEMPEDALEYDAVKLFMQSAHRVRPDYQLQTDDLDYLARICRLTAGMPLGIELAAGWVDVLTLEQIADEIKQGIDILETDMRDVPERHRSVRATFERTWNRLAEDEQAVFGRLSVFRGGFTLPAAQAVAGANARHLRGLTQKALIQAESDKRFAIHELLRQFGAGKLAETDALPDVQARHAAFFTDFMAERKQDIKTNRQLEALALIDPDFENVRTAWLYVVNQQAWDQLPAFLHSLWFYCDVRIRGQEAVDLLEYAVNALPSPPTSAATELALGRVLAWLGWAYHDVGFADKSAAICDEAIQMLRQHDSPEDLIAALYNRVFSAIVLGQPDVITNASQEGLRSARSIGDQYWEGYLLIWSTNASMIQGDVNRALQFGEQAQTIFEELGDRWGLGNAYARLGVINGRQKQYEQAKQWLEQALVVFERFDKASMVAVTHEDLAWIARRQHDHVTEREHWRKSLQVWWNSGYKWIVPHPIVNIAQIFANQNDVQWAVEILAAIHQYQPVRFSAQTAQALREELEAKLGPERFAAAWERGQARELGTLVAELLAENSDK